MNIGWLNSWIVPQLEEQLYGDLQLIIFHHFIHNIMYCNSGRSGVTWSSLCEIIIKRKKLKNNSMKKKRKRIRPSLRYFRTKVESVEFDKLQTGQTHRTLARARELRQQGIIQNCWLSDGKVFVRELSNTSKKAAVRLVTHPKDLEHYVWLVGFRMRDWKRSCIETMLWCHSNDSISAETYDGLNHVPFNAGNGPIMFVDPLRPLDYFIWVDVYIRWRDVSWTIS